jgi:hypothetical protein
MNRSPVAEPLPLAAAAQRLRGKPGRPRGTQGAQGAERPRENSGRDGEAQASKTDRMVPLNERRLLDVPAMCGYLSLGDDTIRELANGVLASARVRIPGPGGAKVLFDRLLVDQTVAAWRQP